MLNSCPLPRDSATYGSGPSVADAAVIGAGAEPPLELAVPPSTMTPAGCAGPPPSDGKSDSSKVIGASSFAPPPPDYSKGRGNRQRNWIEDAAVA